MKQCHVLNISFILAPKIVIYNNACALPRYALNRNPGFFRETKFLVNRFHWHNHTGKWRINIVIINSITVFGNIVILHFLLYYNICVIERRIWIADHAWLILISGCCGGYNINAYDHLKTINTQVEEQRNTTLVKLKSSISYQHQDKFFLSLQTFLSFRNIIHSLQLREALTNSGFIIKQLVHVSFLK